MPFNLFALLLLLLSAAQAKATTTCNMQQQQLWQPQRRRRAVDFNISVFFVYYNPTERSNSLKFDTDTGKYQLYVGKVNLNQSLLGIR